MTDNKNVFPIFDQTLNKGAREFLLKQRATTIWFTGLSGSGKSTIAIQVSKALHKRGYLTQILDGDNIRSGINNNLGFSVEDRTENIRRVAEVSKLFINCGIIAINSFVSPTNEIRAKAKEIIGAEFFEEIFVNTPLKVCEARDIKGLYKKARAGEIKDFTGVNSLFEAPENPALEVLTEDKSIEQSVKMVMDYILPIIKYK